MAESRWAHTPFSSSTASAANGPRLSGAGGIRHAFSSAAASFRSLPILRRILLICSALASSLLILNILQFGSNILVWILPLAQVYSENHSGWVGLWLLTASVAFPPLFGFSSVCALTGFVFGMNGWLIASTATLAGSALTFLAARHFLSNTFKPFVSRDARFVSLLHLRQGSPGLLDVLLARLSPLPYALSNAAFGATFPHVSWHAYALATALSTPRLAIHVFVGARLKAIAIAVLFSSAPATQASDSLPAANTSLEYLYIGGALLLGMASSMLAHRETVRRAAQHAQHHPEFAYEVHDLSHPDTFAYDVESNSSEDDFERRAKAKQSPAPSPLPDGADYFGAGGSSGLAPETGGMVHAEADNKTGSHSRDRSSSNAAEGGFPGRGHSRMKQSIDRESFDMGVSRSSD